MKQKEEQQINLDNILFSSNQFQQQFSVRCAFAKEDEKILKENYRILIIRGQRNHVYEAEVEIRRLIADLPQYQQIEMFIPEQACGYIIGKNGSHIKEIRDSSKARLNMDRKIIDNLENKKFSRLIISGTSEPDNSSKSKRKIVFYEVKTIFF